ncbi:hypothetical protein F8154_09600 [Alkaliphilus pronyensis]|uniref:Uncharacterized protein n=1 Tax=Alkaliphilus pronyensis TaxID=1482732 RepID=A0A6I0EXT5_9FIRM|nr:hypothetical protein [Alkaliphilus pronyensis]KAB3534081.1 hypothetical protein F8154_09600 [Alkaliphilus pronyensis]
MNKKIFFLLIPILLILIGYYCINKLVEGDFEFEKGLHYVNIENNKIYYLGYNLKWNGVINPTIEDIEIYKDKDNKQCSNGVDIFIDTKKALVSLAEDAYIVSEGNLVNLVAPQNYPLEDKKCKVVIKIDTKYKEELKEITRIHVTYNVLWEKRTQSFDIAFFKDE